MTDNNHLDHNLADAPPSPIDAALARLGYPRTVAALAAVRHHEPLELACAEALTRAEVQLDRVREGNTCYADTIAVLERVADLLRGGLGEEEWHGRTSTQDWHRQDRGHDHG